MAELNIYDIEEKEDKNNNPFLLLDTDLGNVYCFPSDFKEVGTFDRIKRLEGKKIEGGVTAGDFPKLKVFDSIIGDAKHRPKRKDKDRIISRIACVNSANKMAEVTGETDKKKIFEFAEEIFEFVTN